MNQENLTTGIDLAAPGGDTSCEILVIDNKQRRKLFGYCKAAWEAEGSPGTFEDWRHGQQQLCGVSSLKYAPREAFFTLVQHYTEILRKHEDRKQEARSANANSRRVLLIEGCKNQPQIRKINALLVDMSLSWEYADSMSDRMFKVRQVQHCDSLQLRAIISALVKRQQKQGGRRSEPKKREQGTPKAEGLQVEMFPHSSGAPR